MNAITQGRSSGRIHLVAAPRALSRHLMNELAARLALVGPVQVLDGGNLFDAYTIARQVRRHTHHLEAVLKQLSVARAFTCHQMAALLAAQKARPLPLLVFDLLTTFRDENVPLAERRLMLARCLDHLQRLCCRAPVIVSAAPVQAALPASAPSDEMFSWLAQVAGQVWRFEAPQPTAQMRLF
jgi:hypothetical protein